MVDRGHHRHSDWFAAMQQSMMHCVLRHIPPITIKGLCDFRSSVGLDQMG